MPDLLIGLALGRGEVHLVRESAAKEDRRRGRSGVSLCGAFCSFAYHGNVDPADEGICGECRELAPAEMTPRQLGLELGR